MQIHVQKIKRWLAYFLAMTLIVSLLACQNLSNSQELILVSIPALHKAYDRIIPAFVEYWQAKTGQVVQIVESYGPSGAQTRSVLDALEADVVHLALQLDIAKIENAGLSVPGAAVVPVRSVLALAYRAGNPYQVTDWQDLTQPGLKLVATNPKTSGAARWSFLALYSAGQLLANDPTSYLIQVYGNAQVLARDARESSAAFFQKGQGNILINYENEMIQAQLVGEGTDYVVPNQLNVAVDFPVTVVETYAKRHNTTAIAKAFVDFLFTPLAQRAFAESGLRPQLPDTFAAFQSQFPRIDRLLTIKDFGNWQRVDREFFANGALFDRIQTEIQQLK